MGSIKISDLKELRDRIVMYRARHSMSQDEFAKRCGLTRPTIGAIERGEFRPNRATVSEITMLKIVDFLGKEDSKERKVEDD